MTKRIVLCADDYGQAPAISQAIRNLIQWGRLSATSCMVNSPFWTEHAAWLAPYENKVDIGLHFNLTQGKALSQPFVTAYGEDLTSLPRLLSRALLRNLDRDILEAECHAQIDAFVSAIGFLPRFIDGHQHVHQFPIIREALIKVYQQRLDPKKSYIRLVDENIKWRDIIQDFKKIIIYFSGTKRFKRLLDENKIKYNQTFAGIYAFSRADEYEKLFPGFLKAVADGGLIMCHPGLAVSESGDSIAEARRKEYEYLFGDEFLTDCHTYQVRLTRFDHEAAPLQSTVSPAKIL